MASRYKDIKSTVTDPSIDIKNKRTFAIMGTVKYPSIPYSNDDIQVITTEGDRLDLLAQQFYTDSSLWWIIAAANPNVLSQNSIFPPVGSQLRIPIYIQNILASYYVLNNLS
jgi:hypothetical protein